MSKRLTGLIIAVIAILGAGHAHAATALDCQARLDAVSARGSAAGLASPAKPAQARVAGANNVVTSGAEVTNLRNQLRWAAVACRQGDQPTAARRLDTVAAALKLSR